MSEPAVLTIEEAAKLLRVGRSAAYAAARAGELPVIRVGRSLRVPRHRLEAMLGPINGDGPAGNRADREDARSTSHDESYT